MHLTPRHKRFFWKVMAGFSTMLLIGMAALLNSSCTSPYIKAKARFATEVTDTTYTTVVQTVPVDSVIYRVHTDTTRLIETVRQGRATATIIREPHYTTVIAKCDSAELKKQVPVKVVTQKWGVDPKYQSKFEFWQAAAVVLGCLLLVAIVVYFFIHPLKRWSNGAAPEPDRPS